MQFKLFIMSIRLRALVTYITIFKCKDNDTWYTTVVYLFVFVVEDLTKVNFRHVFLINP